jgi:hypothetical protein
MLAPTKLAAKAPAPISKLSPGFLNDREFMAPF